MTRDAIRLACAATFALALFSTAAEAQCRVDKTPASPPQNLAKFGQSIAISGPRMVVGSPFFSGAGSMSGGAYVYRMTSSGWAFESILLAADAQAYDDFGIAVAIDGDRILVGADTVDGPFSGAVGAAYFFERNGAQWVQTQKVQASDGSTGGFFGCAVALRGDTAVIGRFWDSATTGHGGSAYVFARNGSTWQETQKLEPSAPVPEGNFGWSVAASADRIVVGQPERFNNNGAPQTGSAFVYSKAGATWVESAILTPSDATQFGQFGIAVDVDGDQIAVGAWAENYSIPISDVGSAYVYQWTGSTWSETILHASDPQIQSEFGGAVAIQGGWLLVGCASHDAYPLWGAVYAFQKGASGWTQTDMFLPDPGSSLEWLGTSVDLDQNHAAAGAPIESSAGYQNGSAYVYGGFAAWKDEGFPLAGTNGNPVLTGVGSLCSGTQRSVVLANARANAGAVLISGSIEVDLPFYGGTLVPRAEKVLRGLETDAAGSLLITLTPAPSAPPGTTTFYQAWIRDPNGPQGAAASNGISGTSP